MFHVRKVFWEMMAVPGRPCAKGVDLGETIGAELSKTLLRLLEEGHEGKTPLRSLIREPAMA
jgi:hypothetical protein